MVAVIQRVAKASVTIGERVISEINHGLLILLGIKKGDTEEQTEHLAERCAYLRIFEDKQGKFNLSLKETEGEALVVSQFTLLADTSRGRRPSFIDAEAPPRSEKLYESFISSLKAHGVRTKAGIFGARMLVSLENNGPVTIILEE